MTEQVECAYAPQHKPSATADGVCTACGGAIPEPWFMRPRPTPDQLVAMVASKHGTILSQAAARAIADALLGYADCAMDVKQRVPRQAWQGDGFREHVRERMRVALLSTAASEGRIPVALPSEAVRYFGFPATFTMDDGPEVPPDMVAQGAPYEYVEVTLAVQVRTPPIDRAAAVRAGVL